MNDSLLIEIPRLIHSMLVTSNENLKGMDYEMKVIVRHSIAERSLEIQEPNFTLSRYSTLLDPSRLVY